MRYALCKNWYLLGEKKFEAIRFMWESLPGVKLSRAKLSKVKPAEKCTAGISAASAEQSRVEWIVQSIDQIRLDQIRQDRGFQRCSFYCFTVSRKLTEDLKLQVYSIYMMQEPLEATCEKKLFLTF